MDNPNRPLVGVEHKLFDPRDPSTAPGDAELLDPSVFYRDGQWWMIVAGQPHQFGPPDIFAASLPHGAPLAPSGWELHRDAGNELIPLAGDKASSPWDADGGRHCPSYVKGWDPHNNAWVERIYYAGAAENIWGPYTIGFLEWDGTDWRDQPEPAFRAAQDWELGSVYEPNVIYHDGKWKLWYVAGSNAENHLVHGYAESDDGKSGWSEHRIFAPPEMKMFDFCVRPRGNGFDAIFSRVWVGEGDAPSETGLWWCRSQSPSGKLADWSRPVQIMTAEDRGWHRGPFKPSFQFAEKNPDHAFVFFGGTYRTGDPGPFPFVFTLGCLEIDLPR